MADTISPQAKVPTRATERQLLQRITQPLVSTGVLGPNIISADGEALPAQKATVFRVIQNCGTVAVKYLVDNDNLCTEANFHGILAACSAQDDGLGSIVDFSKVTDRITIKGVGSTSPRVCTFVGVTPETHQ